MSFWLKDNKILVDSTNKPYVCEHCPCDSGIRFVQIADLDLSFRPHNTERFPDDSGYYDRTHTFATYWDETSDRVVSTFFVPNNDRFYSDKTDQNKTAYYQVPLTGDVCTIPVLKEFTKLYADNYLSGNEGTAASNGISAFNLNNRSLDITIPQDIEDNTLLCSIIINNCNNDIQNESSLSTVVAQFTLSTRSKFNGGDWDACYTINTGALKDAHVYKAKLRQQRDIYVRKIITGINYSYVIDTYNPNEMTDRQIYYRLRKYPSSYCGAQVDFTTDPNYYFYYNSSAGRYYTAYYDADSQTYTYMYDDGCEYLDHVKEILSTTTSSRITKCALSTDTDVWNNCYPLYTGLKFTFRDDVYYIYRTPSIMASEGFQNNNDYHKNKDEVSIVGEDINNLTVKYSGTKKVVNTGWLVANHEHFYKVTYSNNRWQFKNNEGYVYITGGTNEVPPPYYFDSYNEKVCAIFSGHYISNNGDITLIKENFYDYYTGSLIQDHLIKTQGQPIDDMKIRLNRGLAKQLCPFITFQISGASIDCDYNKTLCACLRDNVQNWGHSTTKNLADVSNYRDMIGGTDNGYCKGYGGDFSIATFRFRKMTTSQITSYVKNNTEYQKGMSATLDDLCGIYCEIFNAFCVQTATWGDAVEGTGFRIRQSWKQVMAFDTWYQFGMNVPVFNLLTAYSSAPYYSLISPFVNINKSTATYQKWWDKFEIMNSLVIIRPISGVYELTDDDGHDMWVHQSNWIPTY